jgi:hypothetical protein
MTKGKLYLSARYLELDNVQCHVTRQWHGTQSVI